MVRRNFTKDSSDGVIVEAKQEYTRQLCNVIKPVVYEAIFNVYTIVVTESENLDNVLVEFQEALKEIPKWNSDVINEQVNLITESCSFFNDLLSVVFLSNVRILTSVRMNHTGKKKIKIVVPANEKFIHEVFKNVAKNIFNDPYLFSIKKYHGNVTNNIREVFELIDGTIEDTIRNMLPFKNIIESYIHQTDEDEEEQPDEEESEDELKEDDFTPDAPVDADADADEDPMSDEPVDSEPVVGPDDISGSLSKEQQNETMMENFFGKPEEDADVLKTIPIGHQTKHAPQPQPPSFFDDSDTPDPKKF
jgi:hypothetical protein